MSPRAQPVIITLKLCLPTLLQQNQSQLTSVLMRVIVQSSAGDEMTWQKVHRCGVMLVAHSMLTVQRLQSCVDRNGLWPRGWNDEVATHSRTQAAATKVSRKLMTHIHHLTGC